MDICLNGFRSGFCMDTMNEDKVHTPQKLRIGTTISVFGGLQGLTYENLKEARSAGISDIEISLTGLVMEIILFQMPN